MKFMMLHKTNAYYENGGLPSKELIADIGAMVGDMVKSGKLLAADGLRSSAQGVRLEFSGGKRRGFAILELDSRAEAIDWAKRYAAVLGEVELDILPVVGLPA